MLTYPSVPVRKVTDEVSVTTDTKTGFGQREPEKAIRRGPFPRFGLFQLVCLPHDQASSYWASVDMGTAVVRGSRSRSICTLTLLQAGAGVVWEYFGIAQRSQGSVG